MHLRIKARTLVLLCNVIISGPLCGQVSELIPPDARDSLEASDRRSPTAARDRQRNLDSLAAGRRGWAQAGVNEYRIQSHTYCFCGYTAARLDSVMKRALLTVRGGAIVERSPGGPHGEQANDWTVDTLFDRVEQDLRDPGRVVRELRLDPQYGFPTMYHAETPPIPDLWLEFQVDSFAVVSRRR